MRYKFIGIFLMIVSTCFAQYEVDSITDSKNNDPKFDLYEFKKRTYVGGDVSMRFGNLTYIYTAPFVGYEFYKNLSVGITGIYQLLRLNTGSAVISESTFGGGLFLRYRPLDYLLIQTEFDLLNTVNYTSAPGNRINFPVYMAGLGYAGSIGDRAYYHVLLMYDFINNPNMSVPRIVPFAPLYLRYGFVWYLA